jgi:hypothetical protein
MSGGGLGLRVTGSGRGGGRGLRRVLCGLSGRLASSYPSSSLSDSTVVALTVTTAGFTCAGVDDAGVCAGVGAGVGTGGATTTTADDDGGGVAVTGVGTPADIHLQHVWANVRSRERNRGNRSFMRNQVIKSTQPRRCAVFLRGSKNLARIPQTAKVSAAFSQSADSDRLEEGLFSQCLLFMREEEGGVDRLPSR